MDFKIVADSSSDILFLENIPFSSAPLKIITRDREYVDNELLDVKNMIEELSAYKGKSSTACPSPKDWEENFSDSKYVFCITITSGLSGSFNSACIAKTDYESCNPERKVCVVDSLSAGPALKLITEKICELILKGTDFDEICTQVFDYNKNLGTLFVLESMKNLANNGRVSPLAAKAAGLLGIRAIGKASDKGTIELLEKPRGEMKALKNVVLNMLNMGCSGKKIRISHADNEFAANSLKELILKDFPGAEIEIYPSRALCSFYAEKGGLIIGFEKN